MQIERKFNFTKHALEALEASSRAIYHDERTRCLVLKVEASGSKSFAWYKNVRKKPTWLTIGRFPDLSIEEARRSADEKNAAFAKWKEGKYEGPNPFTQPVALTLDVLVEEYCKKHLQEHSKRPEKAKKWIRWCVERYLGDLRSRKIAAISRQEIRTLLHKIGDKHGQTTANRVIQNLRALYNFAKLEDLWTGENPAEHHRFFRKVERSRFLQPEELTKLWAALKRSDNVDVRDFVVLALETGARKSDILSMRYQDVSLEDRYWTIPNPKARKPYVVALHDDSYEILRRRHALSTAAGWVFPSSRKPGAHIIDLKIGFHALLKAAKLDYADQPELRIHQHDLRRTCGSYMAATGASLLMIGNALGHKSARSTEIYARMQLDAVRAAGEKGVQAMLATKLLSSV